MFGGRRPSSSARMLSTTMFAISSRTSTVALPRCGTITTFFIRFSSGCTLGSCSNTSRPAPAIFLPFERAHQRRLVDDRAARGVDEERGLLHQAELARADLMAGLRVERRVQRDEIGFLQQLVERHEGEPRFALLALRLAARRPVEHAHAEAVGAARHRLADQPAAADQPDGLAPHERAEQMARLPAGEFSRAHQPVALHHAPRHRDHQPEIEVGGRLGGDRRHHGDRNAPRGRLGDVDVRRRDRLRRDVRELRIGRDHRAVDAVVQQAEQDVGLLHGRDQRRLRDDPAVVRDRP